MKKVLALALLTILTFGITGCGDSYAEIGMASQTDDELANFVEIEEIVEVLCDRWEGDFHLSLTDEQVQTIFSNVDGIISSTASYYANGDLFELETIIQLPDSDMTLSLRMAEREMYPWCGFIEDEEPILLNIHDEEVLLHLGYARFMLGEVGYIITLHASQNGQLSEMEEVMISQLIQAGPADLSVLADTKIPEIATWQLTLEEALTDTTFGQYIPRIAPVDFEFEDAFRSVRQFENSLSVTWFYDNFTRIHWLVEKTEHLDMEFIHHYDEPVLLEEISFDLIEELSRYTNISFGGGPYNWVINFNIYHDGMIIRINAMGATPNEIWEMVQSLEILNDENLHSIKDEAFSINADSIEIVDKAVFTTIHNESPFNIIVGLEFELEKYVFGEWVLVQRETTDGFSEFGITIDAMSSERIGLSVESFLPLLNGSYRLILSIYDEIKWLENSDGNSPIYELIVEFIWELS